MDSELYFYRLKIDQDIFQSEQQTRKDAEYWARKGNVVAVYKAELVGACRPTPPVEPDVFWEWSATDG